MYQVNSLYKLVIISLALSSSGYAAAENNIFLLMPDWEKGHKLIVASDGGIQRSLHLGSAVVYGSTHDRIATLARVNAGGKSRFLLSVVDTTSGRSIASHSVDAEVLTTLSGLHNGIVFGEDNESLSFITLESVEQAPGVYGVAQYFVTQIQIASGRMSRTRVPDSIVNPRVMAMPGGVGIYSWNRDGFAVLAGNKVKTVLRAMTERPSADPPRDRDALVQTREFLWVPDLGVLWASRTGHYQVVMDALQRPSETTKRSVADRIASARAATLNGSPVLVYGHAPDPRGVFSMVAVRDPTTNRQLWRKKLPFRTGTLGVSADCSVFYFLHVDDAKLVKYERAKDRFTTIAELPGINLEGAVIIEVY